MSTVHTSDLGDIYDGCVWHDSQSASGNFLVLCILPYRTYLVTSGIRENMFTGWSPSWTK